MRVVFDIDGVIVDTRRAVEAAYLRAGAQVPDGAWGQPWQMWLPDLVGEDEAIAVHARKNLHYTHYIEQNGLPKLAGWDVVERLTDDDVFFCTGASYDAAAAIIQECGYLSAQIIGTSCDSASKARALRRINADVYVDDIEELGREVTRRGTVQFVPFVDDADELTKRIEACRQ